MASVAKHIRRLRTERHMPQGDLAEKLFVTRQTVSAWETGKAQPDLETLERIAVVLGVEVTELIYGAPQSPNLRELKQKWAVIGGALVSAIAALLFFLGYFDYLGTWSGGFFYQYNDLDYALSFSELPGTYSVDIDLNTRKATLERFSMRTKAAAVLSWMRCSKRMAPTHGSSLFSRRAPAAKAAASWSLQQ